MNRQVIPSMLLSVFIVCFFSVLLYQHDKPPSPGASPRVKENPEPASAAPESPGASEPAGPAAPAPAVPESKAAEPKASESKAAEPTATKPPADPAPLSPAESAVPVSPPAPGPAPTPAPPEPAPGREPPKTTIPAAAEGPHEPSSAFTTSRDGESLEDVAVRVYGTADRADTLWRANRDLLPHRNSPLSGGAVLRTPAE